MDSNSPQKDTSRLLDGQRRGSDVSVWREGRYLLIGLSRRAAICAGLGFSCLVALAIAEIVVVPVRIGLSTPAAPAATTLAVRVTPEATNASREPVAREQVLAIPALELAGSAVPATRSGEILSVPSASLPATAGYVLAVGEDHTDVAADLMAGPSIPCDGPWTIEAWIQPADMLGGVLFTLGSGANPGYGEYRIDVLPESIEVVRGPPGDHRDQRAFTFPYRLWTHDRHWVHVAVAVHTAVPSVAIDGVPLELVTTPPAQGLPLAPLALTRLAIASSMGNSGSRAFAGFVDDIRIWDGVRNFSETRSEMNRRLDARSEGLRRYFPVSTGIGRGAEVADASGWGQPLRLRGGTRWVAIPEISTALRESGTTVTVLPSPDALLQAGVTPLDGLVIEEGFGGGDLPPEWLVSGPSLMDGSGWVTLVPSRPMQTGSLRLDRDLPLNAGISIEFDYRLTSNLGSPPADGIAVFLWDGNLGPFSLGYGAGSLGYGPYCTAGLSGAIFGVGIDSYGTFASNEPTCSTGSSPRMPNSLTVRGPGTGRTGYALLATVPSRVPFSKRGSLTNQLEMRSIVHVIIDLSADHFLSAKVVRSDDPEPTATVSGIDLGREFPADTFPAFARLGFAGTTGGLYADHAISNVVVRLGR